MGTEFGLQAGFGKINVNSSRDFIMKRSELFFSVLLVPLDYIMIILAGITAHALRFSAFSDVLPVQFDLSLSDVLQVLFPAAFLWLIIFAFLGLYSVRYDGKAKSEWLKTFIGSTTAVALLIFFIFFSQELFASRFIILMTWILSILYIGIERTIIRSIQLVVLRKGIGVRQLVLITSDEDKHKLAKTFSEHPEFGFRVVLHVTSFDEHARARIHELSSRDEVDDILLANPQVSESMIGELANFALEEQIGFRYTADLLPVPLTHFELNALAGVPMIEIKRTNLEGWGRVWKRIFDLVVASLMLVVASPIFLVTAVLVKATSPGPILKDLQRVGERGKIFRLLKFRSMVENAESLKEQLLQFNERKDGPLFKMKNDPRVTPFGRFIRKTSIDELPQLFNVLKGTMSLVGPRPHEPQEVARYTQNQKKLLSIKPGMTGMAQVSGRSDLLFEEEALLDIYYIENWSLLFDIRIMLKTLQVVLTRKGSA